MYHKRRDGDQSRRDDLSHLSGLIGAIRTILSLAHRAPLIRLSHPKRAIAQDQAKQNPLESPAVVAVLNVGRQIDLSDQRVVITLSANAPHPLQNQ
jgi:hypothetical protein